MTVSSTTSKASYTGNGTTVVFAVPFYFLEAGDLQVILRSGTTETVQALSSQYTVTGAGVETGGSVTMLVAPPSGTTLTIRRNIAATQETDLLPNDRLPAESLEDALDKVTMLTQQLGEESARSIKFPASDAVMSSQVPAASARASKFLSFDANGLPVATVGVDASLDIFTQAGSGATPRSVNDKLRDMVSVKDFGAVGDGSADDAPAFQAALNALNTLGGGELVIPSGAFNFAGTILHTLTAPLRITFLAGSRINYGGGYTTNYLVHIVQNGFDCVVEGHGDNDINCNNNSPVAVYLRNENATKAVQIVRGLRVRNVRGSAGAGVYVSGISLYGQSRFAVVENCLVQSVTRPAGISGGVCQAIVVSELAATSHNPDVIICRNNRVETVTSDDGANLGWDFDGIVLFQANVAGTSCISEGNSTQNCRGRSQKIYAPNPVVTAATIYRDIAGGLNQTTEIAIQSGSGSVRDVAVRYAGSATHNSGAATPPGTTIVSFYTEAPLPARIGARIVDGVTIDDASTGGNTISAVVDFTIGNAIATANAYDLTGTVSNVQVRGKNIRAFVRLNNSGRSSPTVVTSRLKLENISGTLDVALGESDSTLTNLFVTMSNVVNYGADKVVISGVTYNATHGKWTGDSGCRGFFRNLGANANAAIGYCPPDSIFDATDATNWHGEAVAGSFTLAASETVDVLYGGPTTVDLTSDFGAWQASITSTATVTKTVGGATFLVGTLSEPGGAADLKLWSVSSEVMRLKNASAASATVTVQVRR